MKYVLLGPYIGDFAQEILTFRPYIRYVSEVLGSDTKFYISSHINRSFLYDWIPEDMFIPVYEHISRDELSQNGIIFSSITKPEYNQIVKIIKSDIGEVDVYNLPYMKNTNKISIYEKIYTGIKYPEIESDVESNAEVVFIPNKADKSREIYEILIKEFNIDVIGDMNNGLEDVNIILRSSIFKDRYVNMFNIINKVKLVVTNCSEWVVICNIQKVPVVYWGDDASLYKKGGIMNFNNDKCISLPDTDINSIFTMIKYGMEM